jgi:hypothetical protein
MDLLASTQFDIETLSWETRMERQMRKHCPLIFTVLKMQEK